MFLDAIRAHTRTVALVALFSALGPRPSAAQTIAIRNGTVVPVSGPRIERGTVLIRDGKIAAVGANVAVPAGATIVDATGKFVLPGIVDAMTYYGLEGADLNETPEPITPELDVINAYTPGGVEFQGSTSSLSATELLSGGVTTQYVAPADATIVGGLGAIVKTAARTWDGLIVRRAAAVDMDLGAVPARTYRGRQRSPATQPAVVSTLRQALIRAQEYDRSWQTYNARPEAERAKAAAPTRNLGNDVLVRLLHRELPARIQANTDTDIRTAIRLAEEFGFDMILDGAAQGYKIRNELAAKKIRVVVAPLFYPYVTSEEIPDVKEYPAPDERNATWLREAGVPVALGSFSRTFGSLGPPTAGRFLLLQGAMGVGYGMREDDVIKMVTLDAAEILGVADRVGSLTVGKDADVIVLDGPPMSVKSWVERTYVNGELVYQRAKMP